MGAFLFFVVSFSFAQNIGTDARAVCESEVKKTFELNRSATCTFLSAKPKDPPADKNEEVSCPFPIRCDVGKPGLNYDIDQDSRIIFSCTSKGGCGQVSDDCKEKFFQAESVRCADKTTHLQGCNYQPGQTPKSVGDNPYYTPAQCKSQYDLEKNYKEIEGSVTP